MQINPKESTPEDPYEKHRQQMQASMQPLRPYEKEDSLFKFLENDSRVLRFYCFWDDSKSLFGDQRDFVLHYFLADDTVEIREIIPPNSGRDAVPLFLRRQKLPKVFNNFMIYNTNLISHIHNSYHFINLFNI